MESYMAVLLVLFGSCGSSGCRGSPVYVFASGPLHGGFSAPSTTTLLPSLLSQQPQSIPQQPLPTLQRSSIFPTSHYPTQSGLETSDGGSERGSWWGGGTDHLTSQPRGEQHLRATHEAQGGACDTGTGGGKRDSGGGNCSGSGIRDGEEVSNSEFSSGG
ncbi:hypothetical protein Pcinc_021585 [Petrolisthes cinctipes]|uniref:Uncharacterized protein n=1 Tax=Petrolisthes cinctipes TaxID=88211 RepID=A0AAE1FGY6_PETCI|nr:hypothetical protein Pcinc_021585 [Petrolisthes cinctipes]